MVFQYQENELCSAEVKLDVCKGVLVVNFSVFLKFFCFVVAMIDLVHDVEAMHIAYVNC